MWVLRVVHFPKSTHTSHFTWNINRIYISTAVFLFLVFSFTVVPIVFCLTLLYLSLIFIVVYLLVLIFCIQCSTTIVD